MCSGAFKRVFRITTLFPKEFASVWTIGRNDFDSIPFKAVPFVLFASLAVCVFGNVFALIKASRRGDGGILFFSATDSAPRFST